MNHRFLVTRVYVCLSILISILITIFEPSSVYGRALAATNMPDGLIWAALGLCIVAVLDIAINDFAPDKYRFGWAFDYRHLLYMSLALLSFSLSVGVITAFGSSFFLCRLWLDGSVATVVAFLDILRRRGYSGSTVHIQPH